tara:strand:- start:433 stop:579 length:147 start_codon:yes stop_codon:yes gene_type:complete
VEIEKIRNSIILRFAGEEGYTITMTENSAFDLADMLLLAGNELGEIDV